MAETPLPQIVKKTKTYWHCPDGHAHLSKRAAQKCLQGRPAREERRRQLEQNELARLAREEQAKIDRAIRDRERQQFKDNWRASEIAKSDLDVRVSQALFEAGASDRDSFRSRFVREAALDMRALGRVPTVYPDDYSAILHWLNQA